MRDGIIELNTERGLDFGFTSDKFEGWLWKEKEYVYISFIISKQSNQGNLKGLFDAIQEKGYGIKVPQPFALMRQICQRYGFTETQERFKEVNDDCDVWVKKP